jgi:HK97 gp10 family phage protein
MSIQLQASVDFEGTFEALQRLSSGLGDPVNDALLTVGNRILEDMRHRTPVRTGYLLSTESLEQRGFWSFAIYARALYAAFVEFGTRYMAARLFMTRAFELHRDELALDIGDAVSTCIANTFG